MPEDVNESIVFRLNFSQMPILILAVTTEGGGRSPSTRTSSRTTSSMC